MNGSISDNVELLKSQLETSLRSLNTDQLESASLPIGDLRNVLRETIQEKLRDPIEDIVRKLKRDENLLPDDIQKIEKWLIGDAEYYTEIENNFNDWVGECKRLQNLLGLYTHSDIENDEIKLFKLNALITDLKYTLDNVIRYVGAKDRVKRFRGSIAAGTLDKDSKKWLADMITRQLAFAEF